jgi:hypothetical protein
MVPIVKKSEWPSTSDGTTDWQVLFDDPETGLQAVVSSCQTPAQLKQQTEAIIRAIFTRHRDLSILGKLTAFLEKLIPEDASEERLPVMQASIRQLLGRIKENRMERAAAYVRKKNKKPKGKKSNKKNNRRPNRLVGFFRRRADAMVFLYGLLSSSGEDEAPDQQDREDNLQNEDGEENYFQQEAYVHHGDGDGDTEWQDSDMYDMKEGEAAKPGTFDDLEKEKPDDKDGKYESWDDY